MAKIAIDAGHGRYTAGKRCMKKLDRNETREWVLNDRVADALGTYLQGAGYRIKRMDDIDGSKDVSLEERVRKANGWNADFYISVHHNSGIKGSVGGGTEVYVSQNCQTKSRQAQNAIYKHAIDRGDLKGNRADGTKKANFYVIAHTKMPACLIECGFMDSKTDIEKILDKKWSKKIALGIAEGICEVFGGEVKENDSDNKKEISVKRPDDKVEKLKIDKKWGTKTTEKSQKVYGTEQDGIVSFQPESNKKHLVNCYKSAWKFYKSGYDAGSELIRAIQKDLKEKGYYFGKIDGWCGKQTVVAIQEFLRAEGLYIGKIDGSMGPVTVAAWQKYINTRL